MYKGLRAWVWDIKLERFRLVSLYSIFSIVKKETGSRPVEVGKLPNHVNSLCTCEIGVYSRGFFFSELVFHIRTGGKLVANLLSIPQQLVSELGCRSLLIQKKCSP